MWTPAPGAGVPLTIGANTRNATPAADAAGRSIDFTYTVTDADVDTDGIAVAAAATLAGAFGRSSVNYALPDSLAAAQTDHRVNVNTVDYDGDNDGLIDISNLAQLNAMRWDLDGNGNPDAGVSAADAAAYGAAFPKRERHQGCSDAGGTASPCTGYELLTNLNFDTNGNGRADAGDTYWNGGKGWESIGEQPENIQTAESNDVRYRATFQGNGKAIDNLFINRPTGGHDAGLFGAIGGGGKVMELGIRNANVTGGAYYTGILAGINYGAITAVYTTGRVTGQEGVGGLVGYHNTYLRTINDDPIPGQMTASYSTAAVTGTSEKVGGLVGSLSNSHIRASYATGPVAGTTTDIGGLVASNPPHDSVSTVTNSYWDTTTTARAAAPSAPPARPPAPCKPPPPTARPRPRRPASMPAGTMWMWTGTAMWAWPPTRTTTPGTLAAITSIPRLKYGGHNPADPAGECHRDDHHQQRRAGRAVRRRDVITLRLAFAQDVTVISGAALPLTIGSATRNATPPANSAGRTIDFSYTVLPADMDSDGIAIAAAATLAGAFGRSSVNYALPDTLATAQAAHKVNAVTVSYDSDGDGLIEIRNLDQLNAMRWDLDGDGAVDPRVNDPRGRKEAGDAVAYARAFPNRAPALGCPDTADADTDPGPCLGYELMVDLDFDTNGSGTVDTGDEYCNLFTGGQTPYCAGWRRIGEDITGSATPNVHRYNAVFPGQRQGY